jgi:hypothetical protein
MKLKYTVQTLFMKDETMIQIRRWTVFSKLEHKIRLWKWNHDSDKEINFIHKIKAQTSYMKHNTNTQKETWISFKKTEHKLRSWKMKRRLR